MSIKWDRTNMIANLKKSKRQSSPYSWNFLSFSGKLSLKRTGSARNSTLFKGIQPYIDANSFIHLERAWRWLVTSFDNVAKFEHSGQRNFFEVRPWWELYQLYWKQGSSWLYLHNSCSYQQSRKWFDPLQKSKDNCSTENKWNKYHLLVHRFWINLPCDRKQLQSEP